MKQAKAKNRAVSSADISERKMPRPAVESATDLSEFFDTDEFALAGEPERSGLTILRFALDDLLDMYRPKARPRPPDV